MKKILLIGNPNCGKTTLFNALTGESQSIGNWPGVTVEKKTGNFLATNILCEIVDLPGIYSISAMAGGTSIDELIAIKAIAALDFDLVINIIDACNLERHCYLTSQILELGKPVIIALNMLDLAQLRGITIDIKQLSKYLQCPVIPIQAHKKIGVEALTAVVLPALNSITLPRPLSFSKKINDLFSKLRKSLEQNYLYSPQQASYYAWRFLEGDFTLFNKEHIQSLKKIVSLPDSDLLLADSRYQAIHDLVSLLQKKKNELGENLTARIDKIVLHRYLALPIFLCMMYCMFLFSISLGGAFQDFFDISSEAIFVTAPAVLLQNWHAPQWLIAIIAHGVGKGLNTTLTFAPVIAAMFFFLALLETSGYMARAAFVVDKLMRVLGLPGKAFVPMIVGFGCNVPAIMAARTLDSERDRILTVLMAPFMSCSARLAIYAVFVTAFFPHGGHNIVFILYIIGILTAVLTGMLLQRTTLKGQPATLILELPAYHKPSITRLIRETKTRLYYFVFRAGRLIIPVCVILGGLNAITIQGNLSPGSGNAQSILSIIGQCLTPLFAPMGIQESNWPATVGLLTGMLAKEVVIGTLNSLYADLGSIGQVLHCDLLGSLSTAFWSVPTNLLNIKNSLLNPIAAAAPDNEVLKSVYGVMATQFSSKAGAFAYLLFILLYIPCVSTMAVIKQETNHRWMWFSTLWSLFIAYAAAVIFYQLATFFSHPLKSLLVLCPLGGAVTLMILAIRFNNFYLRVPHVNANS